MVDFIDKTGTRNGTPANRANFMALQGFEALTIDVESDVFTETNANGQIKTTSFYKDGTIIEKFVGEKTIIKMTKFVNNRMEVVLA